MQHDNQFGVEAAKPMAPMPAGMLIVTLSGRYCRLPGALPYIFLCRTQLTTTPQRPSTCPDLNGQQHLSWCPTPDANAHNGRPVCWLIVACGGARSGAPWRQWDDGDHQGWRGTLYLALASFYLANTHITTHNNQSKRPHRHCTDNYIIASHGYLDVRRQPRLGKTIARLRIHFFKCSPNSHAAAARRIEY
jgi:hypothetical protein